MERDGTSGFGAWPNDDGQLDWLMMPSGALHSRRARVIVRAVECNRTIPGPNDQEVLACQGSINAFIKPRVFLVAHLALRRG